jgi:hypothetical protein
MRASIHMIPIETLEFNFFFNQENKPTIEVKERIYTSPAPLFRDFPILSNPHYPEKIAQLINFLLKGLEFHYIENIEQFKEDYYQQIESEQITLNDQPAHLSDYGVYDLSDMHAPTIQNGTLTFFVKHDYTHLPYKVSVPFPILTDQIRASYELLPYL